MINDIRKRQFPTPELKAFEGKVYKNSKEAYKRYNEATENSLLIKLKARFPSKYPGAKEEFESLMKKKILK